MKWKHSPGVHFKLSLAGGDISQGSQPWAVSPPPTVLQIKRQFEIHPGPVNIHSTKPYIYSIKIIVTISP
ncbi:MAG: hypothetical protein ABJB11_24590 [Ferruginibacter sp.]